ncbi:hypothetical protein AVEN_85738-1 [Araneus ventricosus]|uniref:Transposase Tc1-like domain-containing protein n=1 Tax=Araneus ventricosus TaxID=182803 RepID=A0A4Y2PU29_ARAVE|nr:hypothetical protein AVEN_85738-1 [Araneus ventricosus]
MSRQTVSRGLHKGGLFTRRPVVCVRLSPAQVRPRLHWAHEHRSWTPEQWGHVLCTDESRFNIQNDSRRTMIWREPGTRYRAPKRPLQTLRVTCLGRDSNERPNRLLHVRWVVPSQLTDIATKSYTLAIPYLWTITPIRIEHDWCGVIWRVKPFHRWRDLLDHRT